MENNILKLSRKQKKFSIIKSKIDLENLIPSLPENEVYKILTNGGVSAISFIALISDKTIINKLYASTLRVGKKEILYLNNLKARARLLDAEFVMFAQNLDVNKSADYNYSNIVDKICAENGWKITVAKNHSKVLLFDTENGKFVVETSANLNENPKIEQFSFEKCEESFEFYRENIFEKARR